MSSNQPIGPEGIPSAVFTNTEKKENKELEKKLLEALVQDPEIENSTNISAVVKKERGNRVVHLLGKVDTEKERLRAEELVKINTPEGHSIVNEIVTD
jgi:hypothetical protein